jgi:carboxypeptidase PM20D1
MLKTTIAFTMASGSQGTNVLPEEAWVVGNMRYSHHQGSKASIEAISEFAKKYDIETVIMSGGVDSSVSDHNSPAFALIKNAVDSVYDDVRTSPYIMTGASDSRYLCRVCDNCFRFTPFIISDEQLESVHGINENMDLSVLVPAVDFYKYIIKEV